MSKDWTKIYNKYKGLWVALADDEITVLGHGKSAKEAILNAKRNGHDNPILTRMPEKIVTYAGSL